MSTLVLHFTREDLAGYLELRSAGLTRATIPWLKKAAELLWDTTRGFVSVATLRRLRDYVIQKYTDTDAKRKILNFSKAFLRYMSKTTFDSQYAAFDLFLALPKAVKVRKHITQRIVTIADIRNIIKAIRNVELPRRHRLNFEALVLFGAYTGQRPYATIKQLTAVQFHEALETAKPVLHVRAEQDKIRMEHYVPLHPSAVEAIETSDPKKQLPAIDNYPPRKSRAISQSVVKFLEILKWWDKPPDISFHGLESPYGLLLSRKRHGDYAHRNVLLLRFYDCLVELGDFNGRQERAHDHYASPGPLVFRTFYGK